MENKNLQAPDESNDEKVVVSRAQLNQLVSERKTALEQCEELKRAGSDIFGAILFVLGSDKIPTSKFGLIGYGTKLATKMFSDQEYQTLVKEKFSPPIDTLLKYASQSDREKLNKFLNTITDGGR